VALFVAERGAAGARDALGAVDGVALGVLGDERRVARLFDALGEAVQHLVPGDLLPLVAAGRTVERLLDPAGRDRELHRRGALRGEPAPLDPAVGGAPDLEGLCVAPAGLLGEGGCGAPAPPVRT